MSANLLDTASREFRVALRPLTDAAEALPDLGPLRDLLSAVVANPASFLDAGLRSLLEQVGAAAQAFDDIGDDPKAVLTRLDSLRSLFRVLGTFDFNAIREPGVTDDLALVGSRLLRLLVGEYLARRLASVHEILRFIGVIQYPSRVPDFDFSNLTKLLRNPAQLGTIYGWGTPTFRTDELFARIIGLARAFRFATDLDDVDTDESAFEGSDPLPAVPYFNIVGATGLRLLPIPPTAPGASDAGVFLRTTTAGSLDGEFDLVRGWRLVFGLDGADRVGFGVGLRPGAPPFVKFPDGDSIAALTAHVAFERGGSGSWVVIAISSTSQLEANLARIQFSATGLPGDPEIRLEGNLDGAMLTIAPGDGDGFLQRVLPPKGIQAEFDLGLGWSNRAGFYFRGSAALEATLPVNLSLLGLINLDSIYLRLSTGVAGGVTSTGTASAAADPVTLIIAATGSLKLGPIGMSVDRVGLQADLSFPEGGGSLGPAQLTPHLKLPSGVGLAIDASAVTGGGYLFFDPDKQQYAGVVQLEISGISVSCFGLLTTKLPDGSEGFSLFIMVTVEGFTPIQLGLGFTLNGVGGLAGINRTAAVDVLRSGLKSHTLDSVLFPKDVARNGPQIVSNLNAVFPPAPGRYVFGPAAIIGWGSPTLLTINVAVVLELPSPVRLLLLGQLKALLPPPSDGTSDEKKALVRVKMDALGVINFASGDVALDATLYDSAIASFPLTGDMALRAKWGSEPMFILAVGGFNHRFSRPTDFPELKRLTINMNSGSTVSMRLEAYLALTSNTVQLGSRLDLSAKVGDFTVTGDLGFDTLFHFDPFAFIADFNGLLAVKSGNDVLMSVSLAMSLTGPSPWHAWGTGTFEICGVKTSAQFDNTFGETVIPPPTEAVDVKAKLLEALGDARNWTAQLPTEGHMLVSFRTVPPEAGLLVHPMGDLAVHQRVVPLGLEIDHFGTAPVQGDRTFRLMNVQVNGATLAAATVTEARDYFAMANFVAMTDDEKLSRPSFEPMAAGARFDTDDITVCAETAGTPSCIVDETLTYDTIVIDDDVAPATTFPALHVVAGDTLTTQAAAAPAARVPLRRTGREKFRAAPQQDVQVWEVSYVPVSTDDLVAVSDADCGPQASYTQARQALAQCLVQHPERRGTMQVVAAHEVRPGP